MKKSKFLVHLHLYYMNQTEMLVNKLAVARQYGDCDLYATMREENPAAEKIIRAKFPDAKIIITKNIGADVWPFVHVLSLVNLDDYDFVVKVHTKRFIKGHRSRLNNGYYASTLGWRWRNYLLTFLESKNFAKCMNAFTGNNKLGMIADYRVIFDIDAPETPTIKMTRNKLQDEYGFDKPQINYPAGTMFLARAHIFNKIKAMNFNENQFDTFVSNSSDRLEHFLELGLGSMAINSGMTLCDAYTPQWRKILMKMRAILTPIKINMRGIFKIKIRLFPNLPKIYYGLSFGGNDK